MSQVAAVCRKVCGLILPLRFARVWTHNLIQ
jgi:hypothetical protein